MSKKGKESQKRVSAKTIKKLTHGLFSAVTDTALFSLFLVAASFGKRPSPRDVERTFDEAYELLSEINYKAFKKALYNLKQQGLIETLKNRALEPIITHKGLKKLESLLPVYDEKRLWDGNLYLVNYDVKITHNIQRKMLHSLLLKIDAIKLQDSLYLTAYNPTKILDKFLKEHSLEGTILVSHLGKRGFLGENNLQEFLWEVSGLEEVNNRYAAFVEKYKEKKEISKSEVSFDYYSILRDDPQLPFELLKDEYLGDKAYLLLQKLTS